MATRPTAIPDSLDEMITLAEFYLERFHDTQEVVDLYPAVLTTVHVPDWFIEGVLHRNFREEYHAFKEQFPDWASTKDFANGLKHAIRGTLGTTSSARRLQTEQGLIELEHLDWWDHAGRPDQEVWQIEHDGHWRSLYSLCHHFLNSFKTWVVPYLPPRS